MNVRFWGTRGSLPVALSAADVRKKLITALRGAAGLDLSDPETVEAYVDHRVGFEIAGTFGGNSSCVQIEPGSGHNVVLDLGSGARALAGHFLGRFGSKPQTYHVFMSHLHWDHIMGFPLFTPAYLPGNRIIIHSCHANVEYAFRRQQQAPSFPVDFEALGADIEFVVLQPGTRYDIAGMNVLAHLQQHSGDSYGWRFEREGKSVVYSTDSEHRVEDMVQRQAFAEFFREADLVIFDAMYSLADAISVRADWGHSSNVMGVELCQLAQARRLCLFHHEPVYDDLQIATVLKETRRFEEITREGNRLEILSAYDGLEISV